MAGTKTEEAFGAVVTKVLTDVDMLAAARKARAYMAYPTGTLYVRRLPAYRHFTGAGLAVMAGLVDNAHQPAGEAIFPGVMELTDDNVRYIVRSGPAMALAPERATDEMTLEEVAGYLCEQHPPGRDFGFPVFLRDTGLKVPRSQETLYFMVAIVPDYLLLTAKDHSLMDLESGLLRAVAPLPGPSPTSVDEALCRPFYRMDDGQRVAAPWTISPAARSAVALLRETLGRPDDEMSGMQLRAIGGMTEGLRRMLGGHNAADPELRDCALALSRIEVRPAKLLSEAELAQIRLRRVRSLIEHLLST